MPQKKELKELKEQLEEASKSIEIKEDVLKADFKEQQLKTISEWKEQINESIEIPEFKTAQELIKVTLKGFNSATILTGEGGIGKTYQVIETIKKELTLELWEYESGYTTPLAFYKYLYKNRDKKLLIIDDIEGIFDDKKSIAILKNALWDTSGKRMVYYDSTSDKLDVPNVFEFKANLIILCNEIPNRNNKNISAMISRAIYYEVKFTYEQKLSIIKEILKNKKLEENIKNKVIEIIQKHTSLATLNFNFRTLERLISLIKYDFNNAENLFKEITEIDDKIIAYLDSQNIIGTEKDKIIKFIELSGMSRATYFRLKRSVKVSKKEDIDTDINKNFAR